MAKDRLLVIDDERGPRESLRFLFKDTYEVTCAESVDAGIAELRQTPPDVIIMDIKMPGKTGIQGLKEIRAIDRQIMKVEQAGETEQKTAAVMEKERVDLAIAQLEAAHPELNPDSEEFDESLAAFVLSEQRRIVQSEGLSPSKALVASCQGSAGRPPG